MKKNILILLLLSLVIFLYYSLQITTSSFKEETDSFNKKRGELSLKNNVLLTHINRLRKSIEFIDNKINNDDLNEVNIKLIKNRDKEEWSRDIHIGNLNGSFVYSFWSDLKSTAPDHYIFSINYPKNWKVDTSVFDDEKGNKVAEYSPGIIELKSNQECFEKSKYVQEEIINQHPVIIGKYEGEVQISKIMYEGGSPNWTGIWYPITYCVRISSNIAFKMTFYENAEKPINSALYERILSSLEVLNTE